MKPRSIVVELLVVSALTLSGCNSSKLIGTPSPEVPALSVEGGPIPGPGRYEIKIIVLNATLQSPVTCDNGVTITPSGPPEITGNREITPAILEVPQSFPEGTVTCWVPISAATLPFTIWVGPPQPKGFPRVPLRLSLNKKSVLCTRHRVELQLTIRNELSEPVTVVSIMSANRLLVLISTSLRTPITLAPREQKEVMLRFACTGFGVVKNSFVELRLADGSVMTL